MHAIRLDAVFPRRSAVTYVTGGRVRPPVPIRGLEMRWILAEFNLYNTIKDSDLRPRNIRADRGELALETFLRVAN